MIPCHRMFSAAARAFGCTAVLLAFAGPVRAEVTVVGTFPAHGDQAVDPKVNTLRIRFSEPVMRDSYSLVKLPNGEFPEIVQPLRVRYEDGDRLLLVTIQLRPSTRYALGVNDEQFQNFRAAAPPNEPVTPYILRFTTGPAGKAAPKKSSPKKAAPKKAAPQKAASRTSTTRAERWRQDLDFLATELPKRHIDLYAQLPKEQFLRDVHTLRDRAPGLDDGSIVAGIARIVASVKDAHTTVDVWHVQDTRIVPLQIHSFRDGWHVVAATEENAGLLGGRLLNLGSQDIDEACRRMSAFVPHDNASGLRQGLSACLVHAGLLKAAGIIEQTARVPVTIRKPDGSETETTLKTMTAADLSRATIVPWVKPAKPAPSASQRHRKEPYAFETLDGGRTLYFAYNRCTDDKGMPLEAFLTGLEDKMAQSEIERLIIDLRANGGGNSSLLDPFIVRLKANDRLNRPGHLTVLIGRATFSSAVLNAVRLKTETNARFIGEPTGGSPSHFGEVRFVVLPNSLLTVTYSTKRFIASGLKGDALVPDVHAEETAAEYAAGLDPALEKALDM